MFVASELIISHPPLDLGLPSIVIPKSHLEATFDQLGIQAAWNKEARTRTSSLCLACLKSPLLI